MSRMNQVMQIGNVEGDIHYYIEDYAYTYLKKQKGNEKTKYFLYGEKEESCKPKKIYIYGITEKPKMDQTYFKEYYPLGFLKMRGNDIYWITLKGQEHKISGYYIFYASNQAMQEYLVDHKEEDQTDKQENKVKRQLDREMLPMKETLVPIRKLKKKNQKRELKNEKFVIPIGGIVIACLTLMVLTSANGQKKVEIFKQVISQSVADIVGESEKNDFIIEEKSVGQKKENIGEEETKQVTEKQGMGQAEENMEEETKQVTEKQEMGQAEENMEEETKQVTEKQEMGQAGENIGEDGNNQIAEEIKEESNQVTEKKETERVKKDYEEYIVKNGDTLVGICKKKYGSLVRFQEICTINNINNADYIAPGQKIYLP